MSSIDRLLDAIEWTPVERNLEGPVGGSHDNLPFVVSRGVLELGGIVLRVYQLDTGQRIIDADDMNNLFGKMAEDFIEG
jgi:hypothetical protein